MNNTLLPKEEVQKLEEIIQKVDELIEVHNNLDMPDFLNCKDDLMHVHIVMYLDMVKDIIISAKRMKGLLEISEEEFKEAVTLNGEISLEEAKARSMMNVLMDMLN